MALSVTVGSKAPQAAGATIVIPAPSSIAVNDLLVAVVMTSNTNGALTTPSGWTLTNTTDDGMYTVNIYHKIAVSADTSATDYTFDSFTVAFPAGGAIFNVKGSTNGTPLFDMKTYNSSSTGTISDSFSIAQNAQSQDFSLVVIFGHSDSNSTFGSYGITGSVTDAWTEVFDSAHAGTAESSGLAYTFTNDLNTITDYSITLGNNNTTRYVSGIVVIPSAIALSVTHSIVQASASTQAPSLSSTMTATHTQVTANAEALTGTSRAANRTAWVKDTKPSTTWNKPLL